MTSIASLLNPAPERASSSEAEPQAEKPPSPTDATAVNEPSTNSTLLDAASRYRQLPTPISKSYSANAYHSPSPIMVTPKKAKVPKDAAVFIKGKVRGELRYPPDEFQNEEIRARHEEFELHPMGHITEYPRHIPYNSEKKMFLERTGRESFEVFQYTFKVPGDDQIYTMMWDYNIGLVRTTSLFRCNRYSKTTPAKMLGQNVGLREICHSITGGSLAAQGYWMPFDAARAIAATFCWKIRYALTPVFGVDFLDICIKPTDPQFGRMVIDPEVVRKSTEMADTFRLMEMERLSALRTIPSSLSTSSFNRGVSSHTPESPHYRWTTKEIRPKIPRIAGSHSGFDSDCSDNEDRNYARMSAPSTKHNSPRSLYSHSNQWTPLNKSHASAHHRKSDHIIRDSIELVRALPSPNQLLRGVRKAAVAVALSDNSSSISSSSNSSTTMRSYGENDRASSISTGSNNELITANTTPATISSRKRGRAASPSSSDNDSIMTDSDADSRMLDSLSSYDSDSGSDSSYHHTTSTRRRALKLSKRLLSSTGSSKSIKRRALDHDSLCHNDFRRSASRSRSRARAPSCHGSGSRHYRHHIGKERVARQGGHNRRHHDRNGSTRDVSRHQHSRSLPAKAAIMAAVDDAHMSGDETPAATYVSEGNDATAASMLMNLHMHDSKLFAYGKKDGETDEAVKETKKRRASA